MKISKTIQNFPRIIELFDIEDDYVTYKSGSIYESDSDFVDKQKLRKAKIRILKNDELYFIDAETKKREYLSSVIFSRVEEEKEGWE